MKKEWHKWKTKNTTFQLVLMGVTTILIDPNKELSLYEFLFGDSKFIRNQDFKTCFSGLKPYGQVILLSCSSGADNYLIEFGNWKAWKIRNIAQTLADQTQKLVLAAEHPVLGDYFLGPFSEKSGKIRYFSHRDGFLASCYLQPFRPTESGCHVNKKPKLIEAIANELISAHFIDRGLVNPNQTYGMINTSKVCPTDSRSAFIYFVSGAPYLQLVNNISHYLPISVNSFFHSVQHPKKVSHVLQSLAETHQLFYYNPLSANDLCDALAQVSKVSEVAGIAIHTHPSYPFFSSFEYPSNSSDEISAHDLKQLSSCLDKIVKEGVIFLIGGNVDKLPAPKESSNLLGFIWNYISGPFRPSVAQTLANLSNRKVTFINTRIPNYNQPIKTDPFESDGSYMKDFHPY